MMLTAPNGKQFYVDNTAMGEFNFFKECNEANWDTFIIVDGMEGAAKTTKACQVAFILDPTFNEDKIVFDNDSFYKIVDTAPKYSAIVYDEFVLSGGLSSESMSNLQNALKKKLTTIRKKNLFIIVVIPWFFMLNMYFAVSRSRALIHVYSPDGITRGHYKYYGYKNKKLLYLKGKKFLDYTPKVGNKPLAPDFMATFPDTFGWFFDEAKYDAKKDEAIERITNDEDKMTKRATKLLEYVKNFAKFIKQEHRLKRKEIGEIACPDNPVSPTTVGEWINT